MKGITAFILTIALSGILASACVVIPIDRDVYHNRYHHRIVRVVPVAKASVITVKVYHAGILNKKDRRYLKRYYHGQYHRPHHKVNVVFILE
jgi:hypothetical protein